MNIFSTLAEKFRNYNNQIIIIDGVNTFEIINPFWKENIRLIVKENEIIFCFSYQHAHFNNDDFDELVEYINDFLTSKRIVIEFFIEEEHVFGGDREINENDILSSENVLKYFFGSNYNSHDNYIRYKSHIINGKKCYCKIRGWNNKNNKDITFN